jgi:hypothetical protein
VVKRVLRLSGTILQAAEIFRDTHTVSHTHTHTHFTSNSVMEIGAGDHGHHSAQQVPPTCSGWLRKRRGKASSWKERFFVLRGSNLLYYLKPTDGVRILLLDLTM